MDKDSIEEIAKVSDEYVKLYTKHLAYLRKMIGLTEQAMEIFDSCLPNNDNSILVEIKEMHSFNALLTISLLDLHVVSKKLITSENDWEKLFFIKHGYLIIYETIETYNEYNQKIYNWVKKKYSTLLPAYANISTHLKKFKDEYSYNRIKTIRHTIAGHIEKNFVSYYDTAISITGDTEVKAISSFIALLHLMWDLSFEMEQISKDEAMTELESAGMGKTIEEFQVNLELKLNELKSQIGEKIELLK